MSDNAALDRFWYTDYRYHYICMRCGHVRHFRPGVDGECPQCGGDNWTGRIIKPGGGPSLLQLLDPDCPTCKQTLAKIRRLSEPQVEQMELFEGVLA
jgi:Zn finger protein HypA/HybF involved in hydrogenase expression